MLERLSIQHFLLLDDLDLTFHQGFTVLTGETGAGKSLLMDALDLCLGARSEAHLVRPPHPSAVLTAVFAPIPDVLYPWLEEQGWREEDTLILKRVIMAQGKSRAFINNQPIPLHVLRFVGAHLVQIHGQFDALLEPEHALSFVDAYGALGTEVHKTQHAFEMWKAAEQAYHQECERHAQHSALKSAHAAFLDMLEALDPQPHEEETLLEKRESLRQRLKTLETYQGIQHFLEAPAPLSKRLQEAQSVLEKLAVKDPEAHKIADLMREALVSLTEAECLVAHYTEGGDALAQDVERLDDRLEALRTCARTIGCGVGELPALKETWSREQEDLDLETLETYRQAAEAEGQAYRTLAQDLSEKRRETSVRLSHHVSALCGALRLPHARFHVTLTETSMPSSQGLDQAVFMVQTNPGFPLAPLDQVASGGERSRLMLALRTVLSAQIQTPTLIFDEIDSGMSGAVAHTVGEHMAHMGQDHQVISITHSPQVAAQADHHIRLTKHHDHQTSLTQVRALSSEERVEEIARMLSGATITEETRATARQLLSGHA